MSLSLLLLGPPRVERDGSPVHGKATQKRRMALLAVLAAGPPAGVSRDRVVGLLWPEADPERARRLLSEALYIIKKELGEGLIESANDQLRLNRGAVDCDLWRFTDAVRRGEPAALVEAYAAPFLDGWYVDDAAHFDQWAEGLRHEYAWAYESALRKLVAELERAESWRAAADLWGRLVALDPIQSECTIALARAHERAGEPARALAAIEQHARVLELELGISPPAEVKALRDRLLAAHPSDGRARTRPQTPPRGAAIVSAPAHEIDDAALDAERPAPERARRRAPRWMPPWMPRVAGAAGVLLLATIAVAGWWPRSAAPQASTRIRLAILFIDDRSRQQDLRALADQLTEEVVDRLAEVAAFDVIPHSGSELLREPATRDSVLRELRATHFIDGWIDRRDALTVGAVRLKHAPDGAILATADFQRPRTNLIGILETVPVDIARMIRSHLGREVRLRESRYGTKNSRAMSQLGFGRRDVESARAGLHAADARDRVAAHRLLDRADSIFREAAAEDPKWFRPAVERAQTALLRAGAVDADARAELFRTALAEIDSAVRRHPDEPAVLEAAGVLRWRRMEFGAPLADSSELRHAFRDLERAATLDSTRARAWATLASMHWMLGETMLSESAARRALAADAFMEEGVQIHQLLYAAALSGGRADSAAKWCDRGRARYPDNFWFHECELSLMRHDPRAAADTAKAWRLVAILDQMDPPSQAANAPNAYAHIYRRLVAAFVAARRGDAPRARAELHRARMLTRADAGLRLDMAFDEASILWVLGDHDAAAARIRAAVAERQLLRGIVERDTLLRAALTTPRGP